MAAGLTVEIKRLAELRAFFEQQFAGSLELDGERRLIADGALSAAGVTLDLIELLEQAGPYGSAHPTPTFVLPAHRIVYADPAGSDHIRCTLAGADGTKLKAIAFRAIGTNLGELLLGERKVPLHIAGRLSVDDWNGKRQPSFQIEDAAEVL
jgi:single-stranded-DNA-specific exonuclease